MSESTEHLTQRLSDEAELRDLLHRYAFGLDLEDWDLWRSIFADEVVIDMSDWADVPASPRLPVDTHVRAARRMFEHFDATQHFMGSHRYDIDGDEATITAHMRAEHWIRGAEGGDRYTMFGTYTDRCVRTADGWRITDVKLTRLWEDGNRHIMTIATRRPTKADTAHDS